MHLAPCLQSPQLSVITPCYNDFDNFESTLTSLGGELRSSDELVVIDSSNDRERASALIGRTGIFCSVRYVWIPPSGIYAAQNRGIKESKGAWLHIVNSGDRLLPGARNAIANALTASPNAEIHVFSQQQRSADVHPYVVSPTETGIWPHQSIVVSRRVHDLMGYYPERYRFGADQIFFAKARKLHSWVIHPYVLTEYLLGGFSAGVSFAQSCEIYAIHKNLDRGRLYSFVKAFIWPCGRKMLEIFLGAQRTASIKTKLFRHYNSISRSSDKS